jgi:hypothetical protein
MNIWVSNEIFRAQIQATLLAMVVGSERKE